MKGSLCSGGSVTMLKPRCLQLFVQGYNYTMAAQNTKLWKHIYLDETSIDVI